MAKEPRSKHARYAYGFCDKKPGRLWWAIVIVMTVVVVAHFISLRT